MKVFVGFDHKGLLIKNLVIEQLEKMKVDYEVSRILNNDFDDHVDFAVDVCKNVLKNDGSFGILVCGTGIGMSIDANKIKGIYCAKVDDVDDAYYARLHNDANVLAIGIKHEKEEVEQIIEMFLNTLPSMEEKYRRRIEKVLKIENGE